MDTTITVMIVFIYMHIVEPGIVEIVTMDLMI